MQGAGARIRRVVRKMSIEPEFHHFDIMGVAHNAVYFYWFEKGRLALLWEIIPLDQAMRLGLGLPVVRQVCEYRKAVRHGDRLTLATTLTIAPQYEGRFIFHHSLVHESTKQEAAEAETTLTVLDMRTNRLLKELPIELWQRYRNLA